MTWDSRECGGLGELGQAEVDLSLIVFFKLAYFSRTEMKGNRKHQSRLRYQ